jgi:signal transduction histidine kinase
MLPMAGIVLAAIGASSILNAWLAAADVNRQIERQLADVQRTLSAGNFPLESNVLRQTRGLTGAEYVVTSPAGEVIAASDDQFADLASDTHLHRVVALDRRPVGGGELNLHVFYPREALREAQRRAVWPPLALGGLAIALVAAAAWLVARHVTQPIQRLRTQVERIAGGDFHAAPVPGREDEIRELIAAVNQMAEQLASYEEKTRASERLQTLGTLGGGIAHQIRNAATGCRIALDLHQRDWEHGGHGGNGHEPLAVAVRQLELIETHIQRFLTLGRPTAAAKQAVDLRAVAQQALALVQPQAQHLSVSIDWTAPAEPIVVRGDEESLVQMLVNLLTNAIEATAQTRVLARGQTRDAAPTVVLRLMRTASGCELAVADPGAGPSPAIQARLFQPFATDKPGGTGLGLVVARQIAEDHGGRVRWERRDEQTWFRVELPAGMDEVH